MFNQMPTKRKKFERAKWKLADMQAAVRDVALYKRSEKSSSRMHSVPRQTLRRHLVKARSGEGVYKCLGRKPVISMQQEQELKETIFAMEAKLFGLTRDDVRKLVFELCETKTQQNSQTRRKGLAKRFHESTPRYLCTNPGGHVHSASDLLQPSASRSIYATTTHHHLRRYW